MKTRKGTFLQRKNRTEGVSKSKPKTQTKAKKTLGFNELVFKKPPTNKIDEYFPTPEGFIDMPIENDSGEVIDMFSRWDNGGWYKTAEMIHYCKYGAFGEGEWMEFQNLYSPNNPFKEIDELIDNS